MIVTIRTDKPVAEIGLFDADKKIAYDSWEAHRELASTLHERLEVFLQVNFIEFADITAIIFYEGPGSFTGLRIGAAIVNALAYSLHIPVVNASGERWIEDAIAQLPVPAGTMAIPFYGTDAFTTVPKK